ncbi:MAG: amidohydrolase family protein [Draconibacterium sp.]|nr:amidohydrolase family protein [Draconibacterium sp.]
MMKTYYDIHCHVFNRDVIIRRLVNVVQSLVSIKDMLKGEVTEADLKLKIEGINRTLEDVLDSSEDVFLVLNKVYKGQFVTTPLMFDLTFADDNDDDEHGNIRYRRRIKLIFKLAAKLIPIVKFKIKDRELRKALDPIRDGLKKFADKFDKKSDEEVEIFDDANYAQQIADLEFLSEKYNSVKPFFSVDPRREYKTGTNMLNLLKEKLLDDNAKFAGIKLYSPAGFSPTDPVLMGNDTQDGVYALCEKNKIPLTVHNSDAGFACLSKDLLINGHIYLNDEIKAVQNYKHTFEYDFFSLKASEAIQERACLLNHPKIWRLVLEKYPNLTINFAHFGGAGQIMEYIDYILPEKIEIKTFEKYLANLSEVHKNLVETVYERKRKYLYLIKYMVYTDRAKIWNIMYSCGLIDNWAKAIFETVRNIKYPNAYTDVSCFSIGELINLPDDNVDIPVFSIKTELKKFVRDFFNTISDYEKSKIMYGSDYYLTQFFGPTMEQYLSDFKESFGDDFDIIASKNPERFLNIDQV